MKTNIKAIVVIALSPIFLVGCASTWKLPSVTVGGAANKDAVLDAKAGKAGVSLTAPLVNVDVPFPTVKAGDDAE